jgi:hypothetical protein
MNEVKNLVDKGGASVYTTYAVEIGDDLWNTLYTYLEETFPDEENIYCSIYRIEGIFEENNNKFVIIQSRKDNKYFRLNFSYDDNGFIPDENLIEVSKTYTPTEKAQFDVEVVKTFEANYALTKKEKNEDNSEQNNN